jgi:hypothetical protein
MIEPHVTVVSLESQYTHSASKPSSIFAQYHSSLEHTGLKCKKISNMLQYSTFVASSSCPHALSFRFQRHILLYFVVLCKVRAFSRAICVHVVDRKPVTWNGMVRRIHACHYARSRTPIYPGIYPYEPSHLTCNTAVPHPSSFSQPTSRPHPD